MKLLQVGEEQVQPFASQEYGVTPDMMTMAKATTNGIVLWVLLHVKKKFMMQCMDNAPKGTIELFHGYTLTQEFQFQ